MQTYQEARKDALALKQAINKMDLLDSTTCASISDLFKQPWRTRRVGDGFKFQISIRTANDDDVAVVRHFLFEHDLDYTPDGNHYINIFFPYDPDTRRQPGQFGDCSSELMMLADQLDKDQLVHVLNIAAQKYLEGRQMNVISGYISDLL